MQKKSSGKEPRYSKQEREWVESFVECEMLHGTTRQEAESMAYELIHNTFIDSEDIGA